MKVKRAAAWLEVDPHHVYKLIQTRELVGYRFQTRKSNMHVEVQSPRELLARRRESRETSPSAAAKGSLLCSFVVQTERMG